MSVDHPRLCENCGKLSHQRCSRCKAFFVCSPECMKSVWQRHKPDFDKVVVATEYLESIGDHEPGVPCLITVGDKLLLDNRCVAIYQKYGVDKMPDQDSTMKAVTKYELFLELLRKNDTCFAANRSRPLPEKLMLNRYYNDMYHRAKKIFSSNQFAELEAQIKADHADIANH